MKQPDEPVVAGVRITHPGKVMFPALGLTKLDIARYYALVAPRMLPHVAGRPLTLVFCPSGVSKGCTYLRHSKVWGPRAIRRVKIREKKKIGEYMVVDSTEGLVSLAQMNVMEIHTWNSTTSDLEHPDRIVFDLDPGKKVAWARVIEAARLVRRLLASLGMKAWVKTTGGRGLHVVVPIVPEHDWATCLDFARAMAFLIVERDPVRAREGAPVSMPVTWADLKASLRPGRFTVTAGRPLVKRRDPWKDYWRTRQRLKLLS